MEAPVADIVWVSDGASSSTGTDLTSLLDVAAIVEDTGLARRKCVAIVDALAHITNLALRDDHLVVLPGQVVGRAGLQIDVLTAWAAQRPESADHPYLLTGGDILNDLDEGDDDQSVVTLVDLLDLIGDQARRSQAVSDAETIDVVLAALDQAQDPSFPTSWYRATPVASGTMVERWIEANIAAVGDVLGFSGLAVHRSPARRTGRQWVFDGRRRSDLLCRTSGAGPLAGAGSWVVVEAKKWQARPADLAQVADYVDLTKSTVAGADDVWGVLLTEGVPPAVRAMTRNRPYLIVESLGFIGYHDQPHQAAGSSRR